MNTPNKLTLLRICLIPIFVLFLYWDIQHHYLYAFLVFVLASLTDALDGYLARKYNQITDFGKFLDPLADKMLTTSAFVCFIDLGFASSTSVLIILFREFLVTSLRLVAAGGGVVIAANIWGKLKTVLQMVAIPLILLMAQGVGAAGAVLGFSIFWWSGVFMWFITGVTVLSGASYLWQNRQVILQSK